MTIGQIEEAWKDLPKDTEVRLPDYDLGHGQNNPVDRVMYNPGTREVEIQEKR
jgi:hypothetical protein